MMLVLLPKDPPFDDHVGIKRRGVGVREFFVDDDIGSRRQILETINPWNQVDRREQRQGKNPDRVAEPPLARSIDGSGDLGEGGLQAVPQVLAGRGEAYAATVTLQEHRRRDPPSRLLIWRLTAPGVTKSSVAAADTDPTRATTSNARMALREGRCRGIARSSGQVSHATAAPMTFPASSILGKASAAVAAAGETRNG